MKSRREALAAAVSTADSIEQENKTMLNRAKTVEKEVREREEPGLTCVRDLSRR